MIYSSEQGLHGHVMVAKENVLDRGIVLVDQIPLSAFFFSL